MPEPGEHRFAILILSTHYREPRGLAAFPDRGKWRVLGERERLWLADADSDRAARIFLLERPRSVRSGFSAWITAWEKSAGSDAVYVRVQGSRGTTSDTPLQRWILRAEILPDRGSVSAVPAIPDEAHGPPPQGPLSGGRQIQISAVNDRISIRTDTDPEFRPRFRIDSTTGDLVPSRD